MDSSQRTLPGSPLHDEDAFLSQIYSVLSDGGHDDLGDLLREREHELRITETQASQILGFSSSTQLRRLKAGETQKIDALTLVKLSNYLGLGVDGIARVLVAKMTPSEIAEIERTRARHFIARTFDVKGLKSIRFIKDHNDFDAIEERIKQFFDLGSIFEYNTKIALMMFMQHKMSFRDEMRAFWVEAVRHQFGLYPNPNHFDREQLLGMMPQVRQYTRHEKAGLLTVAKALYRVGVTVIVQPYLKGTGVYGATFAIDDKPYIVVTDLSKKYPALWFALLHELAHVLYDWDQIVRAVYHLSGEVDTELIEERANYVASELLMPEDKLDYIEHHIDNPYIVGRYAKQNDVHKSLVYWLLARREYERSGDAKAFAFYSKEINIDPAPAIRALSCYPWDKGTAHDDIQKVIHELNRV